MRFHVCCMISRCIPLSSRSNGPEEKVDGPSLMVGHRHELAIACVSLRHVFPCMNEKAVAIECFCKSACACVPASYRCPHHRLCLSLNQARYIVQQMSGNFLVLGNDRWFARQSP